MRSKGKQRRKSPGAGAEKGMKGISDIVGMRRQDRKKKKAMSKRTHSSGMRLGGSARRREGRTLASGGKARVSNRPAGKTSGGREKSF